MRLRGFAPTAALGIGLALIVIGCGGHGRQRRTHSGELSIYTSLPFEGPYGGEAQAIYEGEELALAQTGGLVDGYKVVLRRLDDSVSSSGASTTLVTKQAQIAAGDPSTIAYIGELTPGSSSGSIRILSPRGILQVSPGDTATSLAGKTFARVVPPDSDEAAAELTAMSRLSVNTVYLVGDRTTYGRDIAAAARSEAADHGIFVLDGRHVYLPANPRALIKAIKKLKAGAVLYAGSPGPLVAPFWNALSAADPAIRKFASATITLAPSWAQTTAAARYNTFLSSPGLSTRALPRAGSQFETDFLATYGDRTLWQSGIFGYVAMSGILEALHSLGERPNNARARVVRAFLRTRNLPSPLGTYSIRRGQTSFRAYFLNTYSRSGGLTTFFPGLT